MIFTTGLLIAATVPHDYGNCYIPKPIKNNDHIKREKSAVDRLRMIGYTMNKADLEHFISIQKTICEYYDSFSIKLDINAAVAHDIDALECLLQLYKYNEDEKNKVSDFNSFKSDLENSIETLVVNYVKIRIINNTN